MIIHMKNEKNSWFWLAESSPVFWKIKEIKWDLCILIGLETVTIVSANRIKVAAIETKKPQLCESSQ